MRCALVRPAAPALLPVARVIRSIEEHAAVAGAQIQCTHKLLTVLVVETGQGSAHGGGKGGMG